MQFQNVNGLAVADYHGINVVAVCSGVSFGMSNTTPLTEENSGNVIVQTSLVFPDGSVEYKTGLNIVCEKSEFPNVALYSDDTRTDWSAEIKEWYVAKMVEKTTLVVVEEVTE